jgi:hypothetical protein
MKVLLLSLLAIFAVSSVEAHNDKVLLQNVQVLTFQKGRMTTGRRSPPVQQLLCTNCHGKNRDAVTSIQCRNVGFDGYDVNWKCEAVMPKQWVLGETSVSCEGYSYAGDPYVLVGSCGVEYELNRNPSYVPPAPVKPPSHNNPSDTSDAATAFLVLLLVGMLTFGCLLCMLSGPSTRTVERVVTRTTVVPETRSTVTQTSSYPFSAPVYQSPPVAQPTVTTTHVEHHHHVPVSPQPGYVDGLVTGAVLGSMSQPVRPQTVVVQQPAPTVVVQRPAPPDPVVVERYVTQDSSSDVAPSHTSTSHATTKRR